MRWGVDVRSYKFGGVCATARHGVLSFSRSNLAGRAETVRCIGVKCKKWLKGEKKGSAIAERLQLEGTNKLMEVNSSDRGAKGEVDVDHG